MTEDDPLRAVKGFCWGVPLALFVWCLIALFVSFF